MVRDYGLKLLKSNPGSTVTVGVIPQPNPDDEPIFEKMYICLDACKKGFLAGYRPLIDLDGAFLKTQHGGQILSAIEQDANNHIYVIAYAIVPVENTEKWRWFVKLLHQDLGDYKQNKLCFISDMQKGLIHAVKEVFPGVHHRFSVWHLWKNFNKQWKDLQLKGLLWECARIKEARAKPIITLLEEVRMYAMRSIARNKVKLSSNTGMPCVHVCAALAMVGRRPDEFCHKWLTMEAYNSTYAFHINPIPGQAL
ncbi:uncharacterized protein [Arachis hypogaea]|uniref:uncharacterized protein n=1 Tax=Arachis hypogaea TaxID=3818 RepID=UPI003B21EE49